MSVCNSRVRVFLGTGTGRFPPPIDLAVSPGTTELAIGRAGSDNLLDLAVVSKANNRVGVALGVGNGNFLA